MTPSPFESWLLDPHRRPLVMGILNVTPDSFSDGGEHFSIDDAVRAGEQMIADGADLIDIGGESTRPGSASVAADEQIRRVVPVIERLRSLDAILSIDTTLSEVAEAVLDAGATLINDTTAGRTDPAILPLAASRGAPIVLMHMQGEPRSMQVSPTYTDVTAEVRSFLLDRADAAIKAGIPKHRILLDVGIGFGKYTSHNLQLLRDHAVFAEDGYPMVLGTSRKRFIGEITGVKEPNDRVAGTLATVAWGIANGAAIVRVHDVAPAVQVVQMIEAIRGASI